MNDSVHERRIRKLAFDAAQKCAGWAAKTTQQIPTLSEAVKRCDEYKDRAAAFGMRLAANATFGKPINQ